MQWGFHRFRILLQLFIAQAIIVVFWYPLTIARSLTSFEPLHQEPSSFDIRLYDLRLTS